MANNSKFRPWEIIFYGSQKELFKLLHKYECRISKYAFIFHDKDIYDDGEHKGELKKPHFHVLVDFHYPCTFTTCKRLFTTDTDNPRVENIRDRVAKFEYLTHKRYPDKDQYAYSDIISNDIQYYENLLLRGDKKEVDNVAVAIVNDLLKGVPTVLLVDRYGRDFVIHMNQYEDCAFKIREEERNRKYLEDLHAA